MEKQKLMVDMDGVIIDSVAAIVSLYNEDFHYYEDFKPVEPEDINTWGFEELTLAYPYYIDGLWCQPRFFNTVKQIKGAGDALMQLSAKYDISVCTTGFYPNLKGKANWIAKNLPLVPFKELLGLLIVGDEDSDKSGVDMSGAICIDDNYAALNSTNADRKIMFGKVKSWNEEWSGERYETWGEILAALL